MTGNSQPCCRLCLSENQDELKSVFEGNNSMFTLPQKISQHVSIDIRETDKISTMICKECVTKVENWITFKDTCVENQLKLVQLAGSTSSSEMAEMTFHIKEEPMDDSGEQHSDVTVATSSNMPVVNNSDRLLPVKKEPGVDDYPPALESSFADETASENSQDSVPSGSGADDIEKRKCHTCEKVFSSVGNRKKHEKQIHSMEVGRRTQMNEITSTSGSTKNVPGSSSNDESSQQSTDSGAYKNQNNAEEPPTPVSDAEQQKILFAAGLKLLQKNSTPIAFESLSKIELSYIDKCKGMATMYQTLECACHQVKHPNLKGLLSHLRALRIWFPVFTCYNCMISFTDRSTFQKHYKACPKSPLETIKKLSNLRKRSEVKVRLYQNYRCTSCKFLFSFHDEFCKHIDEEHLEGGPPYRCWCTREFEDKEEYKDHVYVSCRVEYYCDICFVTTKTLNEFQKHAQETHDNSEGFILLQEDNYAKRKPVTQNTSKDAGKESESLVISGKRERKQSTRMPVLFVDTEDPKPPSPTKYLNPSLLKAKPTRCPTCRKEYTTYHNMLRHFKTAHLEQIEQGLLLPPTEAALEESAERSEDSYYSCPDCGGMYTTVQWMKHIQDTHEEKECEECGKVFQFETELNQHRSVHLNLKVYRDSKTKSYKSTMLSPNGEGNNDVMVMCEICDAMFTNKEDLKQHKLIHEDTSNENVGMPTLEPVEVVEKKEVKEGKYRCDPCDKTYPTYGGWWFHNKKMHNQKPPSEFPKKCDYCDKIFQTGASYFRHKQSHEKLTLSDLKPATAISKARRKSTTEMPDKEEESYHTCKRCFKVFSSKYNLKMHMRSHGISAEKSVTTKKSTKKIICDVCQVVCENNETLKVHKETEHGPEDMPKLTNEMEVDTKAVFTCEICVGTFTTKQALKKHTERHLMKDEKPPMKSNNSSVYCKYCKIAFGNIIELTKHMHVEHNESAKPKVTKEKLAKKDDKVHRCQICKKGFATVGAMNAHAGWHKRNRPLNNETADSTNTPQQNAANKLIKHTKVLKKVSSATSKASTPPLKAPEFQCTTCLAELPNDTALQIHILEKHRSVNAIMLIPRCNVCNQDFASQEEYETHKRFHDFLERQKQHELKMQQQQQHVTQLPVAQSTPKLPKAPAQVVRGSATGKHFPCPHCNSGFSRADTLKTHIKMHHHEVAQTEYKCTECDRVFDKQNSLSIHLKIHEKQKSSGPTKPLFSCSICCMGFNLPKDLRMHTITAHPF